MGFEFQLVAVSGSADTSWKAAGECFAARVAPYVRVRDSAGGSVRSDALNGAYELVALPQSAWLEDFVVVQKNDKCYVCFHRGTDEQLTTILDLLTSCCLTAGIAGTFEEL